MTAALFPLFADLRDRPVLVLGGGMVARRKVEALLHAQARVRICARALVPELADWCEAGRLDHVARDFRPELLDEAWLLVAATDDVELNRTAAAAAAQRHIFANVVDDAGLSSVQVPATVERGPVQVAISSGGGAPMVARHLRRRIERLLDGSWGALAELLTVQRARIRARFPQMDARRRFFERLLAGPLPRLLRRGLHEEAAARFEQALAQSPTRAGGHVTLVGAGPGDAGLLTLHALRALDEADVILHDRLVSAEVLRMARRDAERIEVGKTGHGPSMRQDDIHALMLEHARAGRHVVRLKGGDPFVFGRGGEELQFLRGHGIAYEVVPGITAAVACAAYAGIPLTHRGHAQSLQLVTAHGTLDEDALDWPALAARRQTLAFYMGVAALPAVRERLLAAGMAADMPFALIENGSRAEQRVLRGTLAGLPDLAAAHDVRSPALLIIGTVAALADSLHWFGGTPLHASRLPADDAIAQAA